MRDRKHYWRCYKQMTSTVCLRFSKLFMELVRDEFKEARKATDTNSVIEEQASSIQIEADEDSR